MSLNGYPHLDDPYGRTDLPGVFPGWCQTKSAASHGAHPIISHHIEVGNGIWRWQCPCCGRIQQFRLLDLVAADRDRCCIEQARVAHAWASGEWKPVLGEDDGLLSE